MKKTFLYLWKKPHSQQIAEKKPILQAKKSSCTVTLIGISGRTWLFIIWREVRLNCLQAQKQKETFNTTLRAFISIVF